MHEYGICYPLTHPINGGALSCYWSHRYKKIQFLLSNYESFHLALYAQKTLLDMNSDRTSAVGVERNQISKSKQNAILMELALYKNGRKGQMFLGIMMELCKSGNFSEMNCTITAKEAQKHRQFFFKKNFSASWVSHTTHTWDDFKATFLYLKPLPDYNSLPSAVCLRKASISDSPKHQFLSQIYSINNNVPRFSFTRSPMASLSSQSRPFHHCPISFASDTKSPESTQCHFPSCAV